MKFYNSIGPNPHVVRMFMAEKGIKLPVTEIDLMKGDNRKEPYLAKNAHGQMPALELDDGSTVCEITAICEYLEDTNPNPPLIGKTPAERAETRMWTRRVDLNICEPMANGFRFSEGLPLFKDRIVTAPEAADGRTRLRLRQALHDGGCAALLLRRFRRPGGPETRSGKQKSHGVVCTREGKAIIRGLSRHAHKPRAARLILRAGLGVAIALGAAGAAKAPAPGVSEKEIVVGTHVDLSGPL